MDIQSQGMNYLDPYPRGNFPVLLLHGLGADASSWEYQFEALGRADFRPLAVDLPGFGKTAHTGKWTLRGAAANTMELVDKLRWETFDVVGISMGGVIAQQLAHEHPERMRKLALVNTFACLRPRKAGEWLYLLRRYMVANIRGVKYQANMVAQRLFPQTDQVAFREEMIQRILASDRQVYRAAMRELGLFDSRRWLNEIRCPCLVITGELDSTVPVENQKELAVSIPGARQVIIPGARHGVIVDQYEKFNQALIGFLRNLK